MFVSLLCVTKRGDILGTVSVLWPRGDDCAPESLPRGDPGCTCVGTRLSGPRGDGVCGSAFALPLSRPSPRGDESPARAVTNLDLAADEAELD